MYDMKHFNSQNRHRKTSKIQVQAFLNINHDEPLCTIEFVFNLCTKAVFDMKFTKILTYTSLPYV